MGQKAALDSGQSINCCRMDIKNRRNLPDGLSFRNKAQGQFTLIQSKLDLSANKNSSHPLQPSYVCKSFNTLIANPFHIG
jgi:hypothetical protein